MLVASLAKEQFAATQSGSKFAPGYFARISNGIRTNSGPGRSSTRSNTSTSKGRARLLPALSSSAVSTTSENFPAVERLIGSKLPATLVVGQSDLAIKGFLVGTGHRDHPHEQSAIERATESRSPAPRENSPMAVQSSTALKSTAVSTGGPAVNRFSKLAAKRLIVGVAPGLIDQQGDRFVPLRAPGQIAAAATALFSRGPDRTAA